MEVSIMSEEALAHEMARIHALPEQKIDYAQFKRTPNAHHFESGYGWLDFVSSILATSISLLGAGTLGMNQFQNAIGGLNLSQGWYVLLAYPFFVVVCCWQQRLYRRFPNPGTVEDAIAIFKAVSLASLFIMGLLFLLDTHILSRSMLAIAATSNIAILILWRIWARNYFARQVTSGRSGTNVLIIGAGNRGRSLAEHFESNRHLGYVVKGFLDDSLSHRTGTLGGVLDLARVAREQYADEIFITIPAQSNLTKRVIADARKLCLDVTIVPDLVEGVGLQVPLEYVGEFPVMELHREPIPKLGFAVKRLLDIVLVVFSMIVVLPLIAFLAVVIYIDSPGPVFYKSKRVGKKGRTFWFYKLRSMVTNAESLREELEVFNERDGVLFKMAKDPRITRVGRFLRKYSLDELPQFFNVFKGEMSLVGPRPPLVSEYQKYRIEHKRRMDVLPGITGLWQVSGRKDPSFEGYLSLDLKYIENWNLFMDVEILAKTIPAVLRGTGH